MEKIADICETRKVTIAVLGKYEVNDLIYAIYTIMHQDYSNIEVIIAMNELDFPACDVINVINACRTPNIKKIQIHTESEIYSSYNFLTYVKEHMTGDYLLCLRNGASLLTLDAVRNCIAGTHEYVVGRIIWFDDDDKYIGELPGKDNETDEEKLHNVLIKTNAGSIVLPKVFLQSPQFKELDSFNDLETAIIQSLKQGYGKIVISDQPLIKLTIESKIVEDGYADKSLAENLELWETQLMLKQIKLNYSSYTEIKHLLEQIPANETHADSFIEIIKRKIQYIIKKQQGALWPITGSSKAFIVYLTKLLDILYLKKEPTMAHLERLKKEITYNYERKIKILFAISEYFLWATCFKSIYDELKQNEKLYQVDLIYVPFSHPSNPNLSQTNREIWNKSGMIAEDSANYSLDIHSPDLILLCKPYDVTDAKWCIREIEKVHQRIIYIPYNMSILDTSIKATTYCQPLHVLAKRQLVYSRQHQALINENAFQTENLLPIGHPKFDITIKDLLPKDQKIIKRIKKMANGRMIFLWNTSFLINLENNESGTFLNYGLHFLEYLLEMDSDIFVIWRPHPFFIDVLKKYGYYQKVHEIVQALEKENKLYFDNTTSQWVSIFSADVLISDMSSLIESFVPSRKPVILTIRKMESTALDKMMYKVSSFEELKDVITNLANHIDVMKTQREQFIHDNYFLPDNETSVAKRLITYIESHWDELA